MHSVQALLVAALLAAPIAAKTDIGGCVSSATKNQWGEASMIWYVPGTGEVCELLDCGGGRAPPKTNVPGCGNYKGTASYSPTYLPGFGTEAVAATSTAASSTAAAASTTAAVAASTTKASGTTVLSGEHSTETDVPDTTMLTGVRSGSITAAPAATSAGSAEAGKETGTPAEKPQSSDSSSSSSSSSSSKTTTAPTGAGVAASAAPFGMIVCLAAAIVLF
ncbi:hypothetical protein PG985_002313 [Apiospora marii]|uniref:Siderophore biosynthesis enzyme n=1 Tax=Apiospora marii TaxID=335849 RepID=A0ABR1RUK5_9PEZI